MNDIIKKIINLINFELKNNFPNLNKFDLEEKGKVFYMNGQNGTLFDWNVNDKLSDFMIFYKGGKYGIIKLRVNKDANLHVYLYKYGQMEPFIDKDISNQLSMNEIFDLAIILNNVLDKNGIFDKSINDYNFDVQVNDIDRVHFEKECNEIKNDCKLANGFIISKNVLNGVPVGYTFREENNIKELNGWNIYSIKDDDEYVSNPDNFEIVGIDTIKKKCPLLLDIVNAPYGTDLCWQYKKKLFGYKFIGLYDLKNNKNVTLKEIENEKK